jgi:cytochrome c-type biogenesis protein CcmH
LAKASSEGEGYGNSFFRTLSTKKQDAGKSDAMKKVQWIWIFIFLSLFSGVIGTNSVLAQTATPPVSDDAVNAVASEMYCPVCENIPLDVCPTQACAQWRELIRLKLSEGWTAPQIKDYFAAQYGDRVLGEPPRRGLHWLVYILPPLIFLIGVVIYWQVFRTSRKSFTPDRRRPATPGTLVFIVEERDPDE